MVRDDDASGTVVSDTAAKSGPATFYSARQSSFDVRKLFVFSGETLHSWPAVRRADSYYHKAVQLDTAFAAIPLLALDSPPPAAPEIDGLAPAFMRQCRFIPAALEDSTLIVAMADPLDFETISALRGFTGLKIKTARAADQEILDAINKYYGEAQQAAGEQDAAKEAAQAPGEKRPTAPAPGLLEQLLGNQPIALLLRVGNTQEKDAVVFGLARHHHVDRLAFTQVFDKLGVKLCQVRLRNDAVSLAAYVDQQLGRPHIQPRQSRGSAGCVVETLPEPRSYTLH